METKDFIFYIISECQYAKFAYDPIYNILTIEDNENIYDDDEFIEYIEKIIGDDTGYDYITSYHLRDDNLEEITIVHRLDEKNYEIILTITIAER